MLTQEYLEDEDPGYTDCPGICKKTGKYAERFCEGCVTGEAIDDFHDQAKIRIDEVFADVEEIKKWSFENFLTDYYVALEIESYTGQERSDPNWSPLAAKIIQVIRKERMRPEKDRRWEEKQKARGN